MEEYGLQACVSIPGQYLINFRKAILEQAEDKERVIDRDGFRPNVGIVVLSLIHISEPTRPLYISYAVFCLLQDRFPEVDQIVARD